MIPPEQAGALLAEIAATTEAADDREHACRAAVKIIARHLPHYKWVGVYVLQGGMLHLGPHVGPPTERTIIPVGRGASGRAVTQERDRIVPDVRALDDRSACSPNARSEIDGDGHEVGAFDETDEAFLDAVAARLATRWEPAE